MPKNPEGQDKAEFIKTCTAGGKSDAECQKAWTASLQKLQKPTLEDTLTAIEALHKEFPNKEAFLKAGNKVEDWEKFQDTKKTEPVIPPVPPEVKLTEVQEHELKEYLKTEEVNMTELSECMRTGLKEGKPMADVAKNCKAKLAPKQQGITPEEVKAEVQKGIDAFKTQNKAKDLLGKLQNTLPGYELPDAIKKLTATEQIAFLEPLLQSAETVVEPATKMEVEAKMTEQIRTTHDQALFGPEAKEFYKELGITEKKEETPT